jgi:hypothetical protein
MVSAEKSKREKGILECAADRLSHIGIFKEGTDPSGDLRKIPVPFLSEPGGSPEPVFEIPHLN